MSEEQRKDEETEVEGHSTRHDGPKLDANDEPRDETDEVEGHMTRHDGPKYD